MSAHDVAQRKGDDMVLNRENALKIVAHGAAVTLIALVCGLPAIVEGMSGSGRVWLGAHAALLTLGVWLLASGALLPWLQLARREATALVASLIVMTYSFTTAVLIQAITGVRSISMDVPL